MKCMVFLLLLSSTVCAQDPYNEKPTNGRGRDFNVSHIKLELSFDLPTRSLEGTATLSIAPLTHDLPEVALDSSKLLIESVTIKGRPMRYRTTDDKLYVELDHRSASGALMDLVIKYHAQPKRGLFFVLPDENHPNRPKQIWAQGDTAGGNNRFWFPGVRFSE
jgi:aminopeptidase N